MKRALQEITQREIGHNGQWIYMPDRELVPDSIVQDASLAVEARQANELADSVRQDRDARIVAVAWRVQRHNDELALGLSVTEDLEPVQEYVQELRDVPLQDGFPHEVEWPILEE